MDKEYKNEEDGDEKEDGKEEKHGEHVISEEFQHEVMNLVDEYKDSKPCLRYMSDRCNDALDKLREEEMNKTTKEFSTKEMPA